MPDPSVRITVLLDASEEQAYRLLIGLAGARIDQFADVAGLRVDDAGDLMRRLEAKGLVVGQGEQFRPQPPDVALGTALLRIHESLESDRKLVAALSDEFRSARANVRRCWLMPNVRHGATASRGRVVILRPPARHSSAYAAPWIRARASAPARVITSS